MLSQHNSETLDDKKNSIKEVVQEILLCGLSRAGFFQTAAFYVGQLYTYSMALTASPRIWIFL